MNDMMNQNNIPQQDGMEEQQTRVVPTVDTPARPPRRRRSDRYLEEQPAQEAPQQPVQNDMPSWLNQQAEAAPQQPSWITPPAEQEPGAEENNPTTRVQTRFAPRQDAQQAVPRPAVLGRQQGQQSDVRRPMNVPGYTQRQPLGTGPVQPQPRQPLYPQQQEAPARRNQPQNAPEKKKKKVRGWLVALVAIVLLLGLCVLGFLMIDETSDSPLAEAKRSVVSLLGGALPTEAPPAATASGFSAAINTGTAPLDVVFSLTTSKSVTQVRLVDEDNLPLNAVGAAVTENADSIIWMINLPVTDGYEGSVQAQIFDGLSWLDTGMFQALEIAMPAPTATIAIEAFHEVTTDAPTLEPVITDEPIVTDEPIPTDAPTQAPTLAATATPTLEPTYTPTMAPTATPEPTEEPAAVATQEPLVTEAPTEEPTAEPTEAPTEEPPATPDPTATPAPAAPMTAEAAESADPSLIKDTVIYDKKTKVDEYEREQALNMPASDSYLTLPFGVVTYRGNAFRQNAAVGNVGAGVSEMSLAWTAEAGSVKGASSTYYGIGWTGQPAIIKWSKQIREASNIVEEKRSTSALKEVIVAGQDGKIYFLDLADGLPTREAINVGFPMRGTPSLHPLGYPVMTVGQYARKMAKTTGDIGLRFYDLLTQKQVYWIDGLDGKDDRPYYEVGAFDTSALIDPNTDTLITVGTNGMLYTADLNTEYDAGKQTVSIDPEQVVMKSRTKGQAKNHIAVEASPAMYGNYIFYADMGGILRCVDTTTMTTAWAVETGGDAVQAAIALDTDEDGNVWLYTANVLENRKKGDCTIRRFNAETGEEDWAYALNVAKNAVKKNKTPGAMASPVIGQHGLSDLVYFTLSNVSKTGAKELFADADGALAGVTLAMDKSTGDVVWAMELDSYAYASPVAVYAEDGTGWIIQASASGTLYLLDGLTGEVVSTLAVEGTIEGSPAVYNDTLVIGTTGKDTSFIYGVKLQ